MSDETVRIDDGGPAFPHVRTRYEYDPDTLEDTQIVESVGGMSLRDYFAAKTIQAVLGHRDTPVWNSTSGVPFEEWQKNMLGQLAGHAYAAADAMLAVRKAGGK